MGKQLNIANQINHGTELSASISAPVSAPESRDKTVKYPGIAAVIHGNGAIAYVMGQVCGGVIGYPITPSTEISELFEAFRAEGGCNVWGKHPFFFEPEGEHSAQSGAMAATLVGGRYISNASSSQGILYGIESHYVTVGKKAGGFVLQVAARSVSRHSLNVMAGHDDVYALLSAGYTVLFGSNPQQAADLAAIAYKVSALSLIPVANVMDGFATSHMQSEALLPESALLKEFLGDPEGRIKAPTVAQEMLYGAKGRVFQLQQYLVRHQADFPVDDLKQLKNYLDENAAAIEKDNNATMIEHSLCWIPQVLHHQWQRQWLNSFEQGTRQRVPALVDIHNPGLTGAVQNQPDFQAGSVDHRTHFANEVPRFIEQAMQEYGALTGRYYHPVITFLADDADYVLVALGSVTDDAEAVASYLREQGKKVGVVSIKQLQPFPDADVVSALAGKKALTVLERCDNTVLTNLITHALFKALENNVLIRHEGIPAIDHIPKISTGVFGIGAHDLQPRHLIAAYKNMESTTNVPFFYLGSRFMAQTQDPMIAQMQNKLLAAYPETEFMALETEENPHLLPPGAFRVRFHSVGGYGTIATGKLLTDILAGVLGMHSKSSPKYGSEKSGAPTNFYISLSPEPIKITNAELENVEIVISPDHKVFSHQNPLRGLSHGGTFILQSDQPPLEVWQALPAAARKIIRDRQIHLFIVDAFGVAKKHAPTPELEIRMMGIAFIGSVCGHVDRIVADASEALMLLKMRQQITKKFGAKGAKVVESNMQVIKEGLEATHEIDYTASAFLAVEQLAVVTSEHTIAISAAMAKVTGQSPNCGLFDQDYFKHTVLDRFKDGSIDEAAVMPGAGLFMPIGSAAWKDKGLFRLATPKFKPHLCTGCMECALVCPDAAIPNTVHEIHDLLFAAIKQLDVTDAMKAQMSSHVIRLSSAIREQYRNLPKASEKPFHDIVAEVISTIDEGDAVFQQQLESLVKVLAQFPVAKTRPFFDVMEKTMPGNGGLYSVSVDPWKCSGCLECVDVCGPGALVKQKQSSEVTSRLQSAFAFLNVLPNTERRFFANALQSNGETKRLMLDHHNYYAMTGGHGACRGCGEVTAIRLTIAANRAIQRNRQKLHLQVLENLISQLTTKMENISHDSADPVRLKRMGVTLKILQKRLYYFESGPTGNGPATAVIANATGCSSVYASTFPFNPYTDPWINSLFQDSVPVAKGIFEATSADAIDDFRALRMARLDLQDHYDPEIHDTFFKYFHWSQFSSEELGLMPAVMSIGGDGATYDIGFGALSRLLVTHTPIKIVVLNTGAYSNTGGQASTASFTAQDSDLTRFGVAHIGKQEDRKELGMIAAFHPNVLVVQANTALQGHFMKNIMQFLDYNESPALIDIYTTCQSEHGIADDIGNRRAKLAVESRMNPVFVHDPRQGDTLAARFSLEGNPAIGQDWVMKHLEYIDAEGITQLKEIAYTPADFAVQEGRFKKHFKLAGEQDDLEEIPTYIRLTQEQRYGKVPFIWSTDLHKNLIQLTASSAIIDLTEERLRNWRMLEYLSGLHIDRLQQDHQQELDEWREKYDQLVNQRESSMDAIARGMSELAAASGVPANLRITEGANQHRSIPVRSARPEESDNVTIKSGTASLVSIADEDMAKCTNCKTCYQDLSELFEKTNIVVAGEVKEVSRVIPGALTKVAITAALMRKAARVADDCDAEIIQFNQP